MAKDRRKLQHIHSSVPDKQPTAASLEVGEIAVNNAAGTEFLSLKNTNNKVIRFSSDSTLIDWIEKKEVMPYSGVVDNIHLDTGKSNIEIKFNQVAATNTPMHDVVNGASDIDGDCVNPYDSTNHTNGAGFAIDMSAYALTGGNPSFSSITVTHQSNLSGTTNISNGAGGSVLNITTSDVNATDANWNETITNKTSKITTLAKSATTATLSGNTLDITEATRISAKTPSTYVSGTNLSIVETNTDINSCGRISGKTNAYSMEECATGGTHTQKYHTSTVSGTSLNVTEATSTINSTNTNLTGTNLTIKESATTLSSTTITISGGTLTQTTTGATTVNVGGALAENVTGTTTINRTGAVTENNKGGLTITTTGKTCMQSTTDVNIGGDSSTNIGVTCDGGVYSNNVGIYAQTGITETANTVTISGTNSVSASGATVNISGNTTNISGATTLNISGKTVNVDATDYDLDATNVCVSGATKANFYGAETNIGIECGGSSANTVNVKGTTINETGDTVNISGGTSGVNISGATRISGATTIGGVTTINNNLNVTSNTIITGTTTVNGTLDAQNGLSKKLSWTYGDARNASSGETNFKTDTSFVIPKSVDNLTNYDGTNITLPHPVNVSGTVTATGAIYSSDRNLKENINFVAREDFNKVKNVFTKSFNFKDDEDKRKMYGVIAQEVQEAGLDELVHVKDDGMLGVDYTSLLILKVAYLEDFCAMLNRRIVELEDKLNNMGNKD